MNAKEPVRPQPSAHRGVEARARVQRIIAAARALLVKQGYHRTSLDAILARSGGSKATLLRLPATGPGTILSWQDRIAWCQAALRRAPAHRLNRPL